MYVHDYSFIGRTMIDWVIDLLGRYRCHGFVSHNSTTSLSESA